MKLAWPLCATKVHPSRCIPTSTSFDFQFSDGFIQKHRKRLKRWESGLIKAQQQRRYEFCKSYPNTIWYLSKLQKFFSRSGQTVVPIGSSVNGLKTQDSDLDLVLITHQDDARRAEFTKKFSNVQSFRKAQMDRVARILNDPKLVQAGSVQQLVFCNVPIVKFRGRDGTSVDLQFNNIGSIRSTLFVRTCVEWSVAVPIVIHWMNSFFDLVKLKNSRNGLFSSYHLNMKILKRKAEKSGVLIVDGDVYFLPPSSALSFCPDVFTRYPQLDPSFSWHGVVRLLTAEIADAPYIHADAVQDISAAETIVKMIDYYSQLDLQNIAVSIDGKICKREMEREDDDFVRILDPYFEEDSAALRCNVKNGPSLIGEAFSALKSELEIGAFRKLTLIR